MFDSIGFPELILVAVVTLLILGPERLPEALRTAGLWLGRAQRSFSTLKSEIEKEIGMDEIKRQLHNEAVMEEMRKIEQDVRTFGNEVETETASAAPDAEPSAEPSASKKEEPSANKDEQPTSEVGKGLRAEFAAEDERALSQERALSGERALSKQEAPSENTQSPVPDKYA